MMLRLGLCALLAFVMMLRTAPPAIAADFGSWAAVIVSGDARAHSGAASEVFDNARRDLAAELVRLGFAKERILQFSAQPAYDPGDTSLRRADIADIQAAFTRLARQATGGCFLYFTSHGRGDGIIEYDAIFSPREMARMVNEACGQKPTVAIVSSCFSGIFIPALRAPTRMVLTAARRDRTSFGCGETDKYTFFDQCVLEAWPVAPNFPGLAPAVRQCVAAREKAEDIDTPSEPQASIGRAIEPVLVQPALAFR